MSARQRRIIQKLREQQQQPVDENGTATSSEEEEEEEQEPSGGVRFDLLDSSDESGSETEEEKDSGPTALTSSTAINASTGAPRHNPNSNKKRNKNKKNKKAAAAGRATQEDEEEDLDALKSVGESTSSASIGLDAYSIEDLVKYGLITQHMVWDGLLRIKKPDLNPDNEFSRRLGSFRHAFEEGGDEDDEGAAAAGGGARRRQRLNRRGGARGRGRGRGGHTREARGGPSVLLKKKDYHMVPPTYVDDGISMQMDDEKQEQYMLSCRTNSVTEASWKDTHSIEKTTRRFFKYLFSPGYSRIQEQYIAAAQTYDPHSVMRVYATYPYHVDTCLQLAEVYRATGQLEEMGKMLEQALCTLESAWHPLFKPWEYPSRCLWNCTENRSLFTTLYRRMSTVGKSGAVQTAFSLGKLLLLLDPAKDAVRTSLCVDYFALRAREYSWLIRLTEPVTRAAMTDAAVPDRFLPDALCLGLRTNAPEKAPMILLPNLCYSRALALYHLCDSDEPLRAGRGCSQEYLAFGVLPSDSSCSPENSLLRATTALVNAIILYPEVVLRILEKLEITRDDVGTRKIGTRDSDQTVGLKQRIHEFAESWESSSLCQWKTVLEHDLFAHPEETAFETVRCASGAEAEEAPVTSCDSSYARIVSSFGERHVECWKESNILAWLYNCCRTAMTAVDMTRGLADANSAYYSSVWHIFGIEASQTVVTMLSTKMLLTGSEAWEFFRQETLASPLDERTMRAEFGYFGDPIISEYGDTANVNPEELQQPQDEFGHGQVFGAAQEVDADQNALRLFFDTLLPWNVIPRDGRNEFDE
eukprot:gb/GECG01004286.1/.p1 GENE.gb/GECG01004286.1/~~gb/GECG01004286.1/.p1  ORF type:complete len:813 (+),score=110.23 gb/GECG01004286.1/:1-2439(+)